MNIFPLIAVGSGSMNNKGDLLDVRYQVIVTQKNEELHNPLGFAYENYSDLEAMLKDSPEGHSLKENFEKELSINKNKRLVIHQINKDESVKNICEAYLKLYLLSLRIAKPNSLNLDGIFANLPNNAWTNFGPIDPEELDAFRLEHENTYVKSVDKFPCMTDYIVPNGVRIADGSRIDWGLILPKEQQSCMKDL